MLLSIISYFIVFVLALFLTIIIELIVAFLLGFRKKEEIISLICINIITNPILNYLFLVNQYFSLVKITIPIVLFLEMVVILVEWKLLVFTLQEKYEKMFYLSLVMNFFSAVIGMIIF